jgi:hypothetical protein
MNRGRARRVAVAAGLALSTSAVSIAAASVIPTLVQIPVDPDALADDPSLANYDVYELRTSLSAGDHYYFNEFHAELSTGKFYIPPDHDSAMVASHDLLVGVGTRYLRDDTFACVPILSSQNTLVMSLSGPNPIVPSNGHNIVIDPTGPTYAPANAQNVFEIHMGDTSANNTTYSTPGVYTVARLTVEKGSIGTIVGQMASRDIYPPTTVPYTFTVPEPGRAMLIGGFGCASMLLRRTRRAFAS